MGDPAGTEMTDASIVWQRGDDLGRFAWQAGRQAGRRAGSRERQPRPLTFVPVCARRGASCANAVSSLSKSAWGSRPTGMFSGT